MQTIICLTTLMFMNGAYLFISFNMESMIPEAENEPIEEVVVASSTINREFDPSDILDLDILDFAVDELNNSEENVSTSRRPHLVHDRV